MGLENSENLVDDYELVNCIATGNTTQVWEVKQVSTGQPFAMKLLLSEKLTDAEAKASLKHEANVGKSLEHPNIIRVFDLKTSKKFWYFLMEHFRAPNLKSMLRNELPAAQSRAKKMLECLASALALVHEKGWVHRDIKPDNVLVSKGGEIRLIDFSLCSRPSNAILHAMTRKAAIVIQGTRTYLAPELIQRKPLTFAADIYSLGIMFFEVLTGFPPFRTANPNDLLVMHVRDMPDVPSSFNKNVTPEADALVMKMIQKNPKNRPARMQDVLMELQKIQLFKENPESLAARQADEAKSAQMQSLDTRIDSRADADRKAAGIAALKKEEKKSEKVRFRLAKEESEESKKPAPAAAPVAAQQPMPMPGMPMPGMMPGMFPGMMPGQVPMMPMPGQMFPGQMPGMPMPGMMPGQMPFPAPMPGMPPQYPGMPGQMPGMPPMLPGMGMPGMPMPGQMPPGMPTPMPAAPAQQPAPVQKKPPVAQPAKPAEDIPLASMDDLIVE